MTKKPMISHHVASAAARLRHVFVRDLEVMAVIGIYDHEKVTPQRLVINIDESNGKAESCEAAIKVGCAQLRVVAVPCLQAFRYFADDFAASNDCKCQREAGRNETEAPVGGRGHDLL